MAEISTKPYLLRALFEWCVDNGYTPHIAVKVDSRTQVPAEYVKGGEITLKTSTEKVKLSPAGIKVTSASTVEVNAAAMVNVVAPFVQVDSPFTYVKGLLYCETLITNCVISPSYTPGAGNVW